MGEVKVCQWRRTIAVMVMVDASGVVKAEVDLVLLRDFRLG